MYKIIAFIIAKRHWIWLFIFEVFALSLLFNNTLYHRFINHTYSTTFIGKANSLLGDVRSINELRKENELLTLRLAKTEKDLHQLQQSYDYITATEEGPMQMLADTSLSGISPFEFVTARINSISLNRRQNLALLDRGRKDGIKEQMGVMSAFGVAGIISSVGENYSVMVPLINTDLRLSCKLKRNGYIGTLAWGGPGDPYLYLTEITRHASYHKGDTVVTSGFSSIFPPNLYVGTIQEGTVQNDQILPNNSAITIDAGTDFSTIEFVYIITGGFTITSSQVDSIFNGKR